jgi:nucleoside-diphosphate-sugar epimerase
LSRHAFILGGTGQVGVAVAGRLAEHGWRVTLCSRRGGPLPDWLAELGVDARRADRERLGELERALGEGADLMVDVICMDATHARQLVALRGSLGAVVAISSASVYVDAHGRTLDEAAAEEDFPRLPEPVPETHATVEPGEATYSTRKVALERELLATPDLPTTIVRPCAIHGPYSHHAREWYFLKRALDRRPAVLIDHRGSSRFHTTSVDNLAELIRLAADRPADGVLNCGDPHPPTALDIARSVWAYARYEPVEVLLPGAAERPEAGATPWSIPHPFVVDMREAELTLGYRPVTTYADAVGATLAWLEEEIAPGEWRSALPQLAAYPWNLFDYAAEDELLARLRR